MKRNRPSVSAKYLGVFFWSIMGEAGVEKGEEDVLGYRTGAHRSLMLERFMSYMVVFPDNSEVCTVVGCLLKSYENVPGVLLHRGRLS